jgi:hypothetical protein
VASIYWAKVRPTLLCDNKIDLKKALKLTIRISSALQKIDAA